MDGREKDLGLVFSAEDGLVQIVLLRGADIAVAQTWHCDNRATEILPAALKDMLTLLGLSARDLVKIACVNGPGSFTGIRLVLALSQALHRVSGAKLCAINALACLAYEYQLRRPQSEKRVLFVVTHARRNLVHVQPYLLDGRPQPMADISLIDPKVLCDILPTGAICLGNALARYPELFSDFAQSFALTLEPEILHPSASALQLAAQASDYQDFDLEPLYVRPCDALENLSRLAARQGLSHEEAWQSYRQILQKAPCSAI